MQYVRDHGDLFDGIGYSTFPLLEDGTIDIHQGMFVEDGVVVGWAGAWSVYDRQTDSIVGQITGELNIVSAQPMDEFAANVVPTHAPLVRVYFI
jgi:hypothetical protein